MPRLASSLRDGLHQLGNYLIVSSCSGFGVYALGSFYGPFLPDFPTFYIMFEDTQNIYLFVSNGCFRRAQKVLKRFCFVLHHDGGLDLVKQKEIHDVLELIMSPYG